MRAWLRFRTWLVVVNVGVAIDEDIAIMYEDIVSSGKQASVLSNSFNRHLISSVASF